MNKKEPTIEEILEKINLCNKRLKHARAINDKIGYEIALKEHERLHSEYEKILYKEKNPSLHYEKKY